MIGPGRSWTTAVGSTSRPKTGDVDMTLAELWNGKTWAIQSPPSPGVSGHELDAVFCQPAVPCTAAGDHDTTVSRPWWSGVPDRRVLASPTGRWSE
jgi:hypothetical protein